MVLKTKGDTSPLMMIFAPLRSSDSIVLRLLLFDEAARLYAALRASEEIDLPTTMTFDMLHSNRQ
jgi:hypothetical protein